MSTSPITTFANQRLEPALYPQMAKTLAVKIAANQTLAKGTVLGEAMGTSQVDTLTITGSPTGGTFTLTVGGQTTAALAYNSTAAQVEAALQALSTVGSNGVTVSGTQLPGGSQTVTFAPGAAVTMTHTDSLTGGTSPAVSITQTTAGAAGTPGVYKAYASGATDGSQVAKGILAYDVATDASGNITLGGQATGGEWGQTEASVAMFITGYFYTGDLTGLDANAVTNLSGRFIQGTIGSGILGIGF